MSIILSIQVLPPVLTISFLIVVVVLLLLKLFLYTRISFIEYLAIIATTGIYFLLKWLFKDLVLLREIVLTVCSGLVVAYSIYDLFYYVGKIKAFNIFSTLILLFPLILVK